MIMVQNGLGMEADLARIFPTSIAVAWLICRPRSPMAINHADFGELTIGSHTVKDPGAGEGGHDLKMPEFPRNWRMT